MKSMFNAKFGHCKTNSSARRFLKVCREVEAERSLDVETVARRKLEKNFGMTLVTKKMVDIEVRRQMERVRGEILAEANQRFWGKAA
jgi:hypothetical protein